MSGAVTTAINVDVDGRADPAETVDEGPVAMTRPYVGQDGWLAARVRRDAIDDVADQFERTAPAIVAGFSAAADGSGWPRRPRRW